jgi:hypothetical protein
MSGPQACSCCPKVFTWGRDEDSHLAVAAAGESCAENAYWKLKGHMAAEHPNEGHRCGRRGDLLARDDGSKDWWSTSRGLRTCSYCGSLHPDDLFAAIEAGTCRQISGTDKNYKIYVDMGAAGGSSHAKFYYQHFDEAQRDRFIALYNEKKLPLEPRFGLYVLPYFARQADAPERA